MKQADLQNLAQNITAAFGGGSLSLLGDSPSITDYTSKKSSTGLYNLDWALSGGMINGGQHEIFGNEGDGKTTTALTIAAHLQSKYNKQIHIIDAEHKLNLTYAQALGLDINKILLTQPSHGEHALDVMQATLSTGMIDVCIIDSVSALVPLSEINGEFTDANMGAHARLMSKMCRVMTPIISQHNIIVIYINQIRHKIGVFFGSPETTTGGKALKFYCGIRMRVSSSKYDSDPENKRWINVNVVKNQWGHPYRKLDKGLLLNLGVGFDKKIDIVDGGLRAGILDMASSHVKYGKLTLGNGKANAGEKIFSDPDLLNEIESKIMQVKNE